MARLPPIISPQDGWLEMLCTLLEPTSGTARVDGYDVVRQANMVRQSLGAVLTGERSIYWKLTGKENLEYFAALYHIPGPVARRRVEELLARFDLQDRADEYVEKYSSGMKQRVAVARALLASPPLLLLDEPTVGLDPQAARNLRAVLAIVKKDWLHSVRYPLSAVFRVLQPIIWLAPVYFLGKSFASPEGNVGFAAYAGTKDYMSFILLGTILSQYLSAVLWGMGYALKNEMDSGMLESNWMTPMSRPLLLVGRTLASVGITTFNSLGVLFLGWLLFGFRVTGGVWAAFLTALPMMIALYGFGFAFAAVVMLIRDPNTLIDVSDYLVSVLAGGQFPVQVLPRFLLPLSLALPLTYGYDAIRGYLLQTRTILPVRYEIMILIVSMGVTVPLGYVVFKLVERRCKQWGTLGMH